MSKVVNAVQPSRGFYPERDGAPEEGVDYRLITTLGHLTRLHRTRPSRYRAIVEPTRRAGESIRDLGMRELAWQAASVRADLGTKGFTLEVVGRAFALVRELAESKLGERHYDVQLMGGWALLNGMVAEMATGEGKTLTATLPASVAALAGVPVHIITVNDYLAARDAEWMRPVYEGLGLTVGAITHDNDLEARRAAYRCDVTYCTNKELVFDYLRDRLEMGRKPGAIRRRVDELASGAGRADRLRLRGLCYAIVDEADSVLIDEARTPCIISGRGDSTYENELYRVALELAGQLRSADDFRIDFPKRTVELTDAGKARLEEIAAPRGGYWRGRLRREDLVVKALTVEHLYQRDKHYVVKEDKVHIVDEYTGRVMPGRMWEGGIHQLVETKEGCEPTARTEVLARISYQRFFRRYLALAGMTGTAQEASRELWAVYRLRVATIPTAKPMIRRALPARLFRTATEKWAAVVARIAELNALGRPVLVGTRTVADSEHLAALLAAAGLSCRVLNALQDREEAAIVAQAGERGRITVATNMAGRGTDIRLGSGVRELGGLHVIACERHDAGRIDRQLFGRCGRQGDPGTYEAFVSLEDDLIRTHARRAVELLPSVAIDPRSATGRWIAGGLVERSQRAAERNHYRMRRDLLKLDEIVSSALAFSGKGE